MRSRLSLNVLLPALLAIAMVTANTALSEEPESVKLNFNSSAPLTEYFKSSDEAVEVYQQRLKSAAETGKISAFGAVFGSTEDAAASESKDKQFSPYFKEAGSLVRVDVQSLPRLGDTIRRVAYIVFFEHNLIFCDVWFYHTVNGWAPLKSDLNANGSGEVIKSIPDVFFN